MPYIIDFYEFHLSFFEHEDFSNVSFCLLTIIKKIYYSFDSKESIVTTFVVSLILLISFIYHLNSFHGPPEFCNLVLSLP